MQVVTFDLDDLVQVALQKKGNARPRMIVQGAVVITAQDLVQVDVEETVTGDDPPAAQLRIAVAIAIIVEENQVRFARHQTLQPGPQVVFFSRLVVRVILVQHAALRHKWQ